MSTLSKSKKKAVLTTLDELADRMPSLLEIDHPCAQKHISEARKAAEVCDLFFSLLFCYFLLLGLYNCSDKLVAFSDQCLRIKV